MIKSRVEKIIGPQTFKLIFGTPVEKRTKKINYDILFNKIKIQNDEIDKSLLNNQLLLQVFTGQLCSRSPSRV